MNNLLQGLVQERKTRKFGGVSQNPQIRAEITENVNTDYISVRPNPTCYQCRKLVEEVKRLKQIMKEGPRTMQLKNPGWENDYAEDPEQISPRVNAAFVYKKSRSRTEEIEQLRKEVTRLQRELRLRSDEVYALRGRGPTDRQISHQSNEASIHNVRDHYTLGETENKMRSLYTQLYQKEWSQAYAYQTRKGVEKTVAHGNLLSIIQLSFSQCRELADAQLSQILKASSPVAPGTSPSTSNTAPRGTTNSQQQPKQSSVTTPDGSRHTNPLYQDAVTYQIKICDQLFPYVQEKVTPNIMKIVNLSPSLKSSVEITTYSKKCLQVAWKISTQSDKVHLDNSTVRFSDFDTVKYDYFDEELENLDYVVWPALLSEGSQLLAKGVALATSNVQ
ncbi:uncharacterized protein LOC125659607 isoform X2 [Ostrea edulis]|uniref:uncharacterized protein LOC125659607 isoform X2 n=1 Tax=Ostrea edulis TaxID=37623 RepID=UPI0024AFC5E1|nr:uncharacterized protein LOC125659607 isoform X2 [Ostrea edulis]